LNSNVIGSVSQQYAFCRVIGRLIKREMRMRIDLPLDTNVGADLEDAVALVTFKLFDALAVVPFVFVDFFPLAVVDLGPFEAIL